MKTIKHRGHSITVRKIVGEGFNSHQKIWRVSVTLGGQLVQVTNVVQRVAVNCVKAHIDDFVA